MPESPQQEAIQATLTGTPVAPRPHGPIHGAIAALLGANGFDLLTTLHALGNGAHETNPALAGVAGNPAALSAVKMGAAGAESFAFDKLYNSHPKLALLLDALATGIPLAAGIHNLKVQK